MQKQMHLNISEDDISPLCLLPGDPARVDVIGKMLGSFKIIAQNREFRIGTGKYRGKKITVCSTGIGCPSTAIAVEELINAGAKYLIRVGTCGGAWRAGITAGSLIIPTACIRDEGTTAEYIQREFPAVADFDVVRELVSSAQSNGVNFFAGINRTHDAFYGSQESIVKWGKYLLDARWKNTKTPILSSEMECSALYVIASLRGVKAGAVLAVNANPEPLRNRLFGKKIPVIAESNEKLTERTVDSAIKVALQALCSFNPKKV